MEEFLLPLLNLVPDLGATPGTEIFKLFAFGEDKEEALAHRGRHLAAGAKKRRCFKVLIIRLTCHL